MISAEFWTWYDDEAAPKLKGRANTFRKMFEYLDVLDRPVAIVETGCVRKADNWDGDGQSTILFDRYVRANGGVVYSVDIDRFATKMCRSLVSKQVKCCTGDSVRFLARLAANPPNDLPAIDLLYLDSFDLQWSYPLPSAAHHLAELTAILPLIRDDTLVVVDDAPAAYSESPVPHIEVGGKGKLVADHAAIVGADLEFYEYQIGWTHMNRLPENKGTHATKQEITKLIERARAHAEAGRDINAEILYRLIIDRTSPPQTGLARIANGEACVFYARLCVARHQYGTAMDWYRRALLADPLAVDYRLDLCMKAYRPLGNIKMGLQEARRATKIEPDNVLVWAALGALETDAANADGAIACYDRALELCPDDPDAMLNRVTVALDVADYATARALCEKVLKTDRAPDAMHALGMIAYREGRHEDAIELYDKAIAGNCYNIPTAHWNKSLVLHSLGRYVEGWREHEWRRHDKVRVALAVPLLRFTVPMWTGEEPPGTSLHVHSEAGMGDNICIARYLKVLVEKGYDVRYEAYEDMVSLMARSFPDVKVCSRAPDYPGSIGIQPFDRHVPIGSLPHIFGTEVDTVPWEGPYIKPDPALVATYRAMLPSVARIGLCWSSGIRETEIWLKEYGLRKSMHFDTLWSALCASPHALPRFVSLQVGPERAQQHDIYDVLPANPSWDDTAALIECLDLVITVDTAVAHLAGAMGKPVWVMCQRDAASWHFMCWRPGAPWNERSPWYPSARLFRQHEFNAPHRWDDVARDVARALTSGG
jgi:tetratricopeptide (TPR) repeat protein